MAEYQAVQGGALLEEGELLKVTRKSKQYPSFRRFEVPGGGTSPDALEAFDGSRE